MRAHRTLRPDIIIVGSSGMHAVNEVTAVSHTFPNTPVVVAALGLTEAATAQAIEAGATLVAPITVLGAALANLIRVVSKATPSPENALERNTVSEFHDRRTGKLNASSIAKAFGISLAVLANSIGLTPSALSKRPTARTAQDELREIEFAWAALKRLLGSEESARAWLNTAHPDLGGQPAISLLTKGSAKAFANYIRSALSGQPT